MEVDVEVDGDAGEVVVVVVAVSVSGVVVAVVVVDTGTVLGVEEAFASLVTAASTVFSALEADFAASMSLSPTSLKRSSDKS